MTSFELKKCIIDLAFTAQSEAAFVSCYIPFASPFSKHVIDFKPAGGVDRSDDAFKKIINFVSLGAPPPARSVAAFARLGSRPCFLALPLPVPLAPHVAVGPLPEIYPLLEAASRNEPFIVGVCAPGELRILFVDLGVIVRETRVEGRSARRAAVLEEALRYRPSDWLVLAGPQQEIARLCDSSADATIQKVAGTVPVSMQRVQDSVQAAAAVVKRRRDQISNEQARKISRNGVTSESTATGLADTLRALTADVAETIWLAADCRPEPAVICGDCAGVEWKLDRPRFCTRCKLVYRYETDSREQIVRQALRQGCAVEILWKGGVLAEFGGLACTVRPPASGRCSDAENRATRPAVYEIRMSAKSPRNAPRLRPGSVSASHTRAL